MPILLLRRLLAGEEDAFFLQGLRRVALFVWSLILSIRCHAVFGLRSLRLFLIDKEAEFAENLSLSLAHGLDSCTLLFLSGFEGSDKSVLGFKGLS